MSERHTHLLDAIFTSSPDAVLAVDERGCIQMASPAVATLFGYRPEDLVGQTIELLVPDDLRNAHRRHRAAFEQEPVARPMGAGLELFGRRRDGSIIPVDVSLAPLLQDGGRWTAAFVRDATDRRRNDRLMRAINEVTRAVLAGEDATELLTVVADRARTLVDASAAWVVLPDKPERARLRIAAASGRAADGLIGSALDAELSLSARAMRTSRPFLVADMSAEPRVVNAAREGEFGPGAYLPMLTQDGPIGVLVVARDAGSTDFTQAEVDAVEVFGSATAVGQALGEARDALEDMHILAEHERIARDLHDTVIQRLFGLGMGLQAVEGLADGRVGDRIRSTVQAIDEVIREIRETIFDLNRPPSANPDVRQRVLAVVDEVGNQLGFHPRVTFRGPVEAQTSDELLDHVLAVTREALTNAGRHARASRVDVVVAATPGMLTVSVADDGVGLPDGPTAGHGLANMAQRATQLGGQLAITRRRPTGTLLEWRAPAHPAP